MTTSRKPPSAAFWATVVVVVALVGYPLSMGPACWAISHDLIPSWAIEAPGIVYRPIGLLYENGPAPIKMAIYWYASLWADDVIPPT